MEYSAEMIKRTYVVLQLKVNYHLMNFLILLLDFLELKQKMVL